MSVKTKLNARISAVGHYVPDNVIDNKYFEKYLETSDTWIKERTGIFERRWLDKDKPTSFMAIKAIEDCLKNTDTKPEDIDLLIVTTVTPDMMYPSTACVIQNKMGMKNAWGFDLSAACSGFLFGLNTGAQFIRSGVHKKVIVVGADKMSAIINPDDRNTVILFGDGAGAVLLEPIEDTSIGILDAILHIDGSGEQYLNQKAGGSLFPATLETVENKMHFVHQEGKAVFKVAVIGMAEVSYEIMEKNNLKSEDIAWLVPHQANLRIISACADRMGLSMDKVMVNINKYGNTTSGTIPICLSEWHKEGKLKKGDNIVLASFGAGYTWGAILVKWDI